MQILGCIQPAFTIVTHSGQRTTGIAMQDDSLKMVITFFIGFLCLLYAAAQNISSSFGKYPGDILVIAIFPIHDPVIYETGKKPCTSITDDEGIQQLEAFIYSLNQVNKEANLLKGFTLGAFILDSCDRETFIMNQIVKLMRYIMAWEGGVSNVYR